MNFSNFSETELQCARMCAAQKNRNIAKASVHPDFGFAAHITKEQKVKYAEKEIACALEIEAGLHDHNFTVRQRMYYFLTGESVPFLARA